MSTYKEILIDAPLEGSEYERLYSLKDNPILVNSDNITLVNVYNSQLKNRIPLNIDCKDLDRVECYINHRLSLLKERIDPEEKLNWKIKALFNREAKNACCFYAKETGADLVIVPTRGIEQSHIHNESFAQYMLESCSADILVLKPQS